MKRTLQQSIRYHRLSLLLVFAMAAPICLVGLGAHSFGSGDQTTHAKVVQEMVQDGHYWRPTKMGEPYQNKPPLKMWLSSLVVTAFGESNFTYRVLDGLFGFATVLLVYFAGVRLFGMRSAGVYGAALLLGSRGFVFAHGIREAVQDPAANFFIAAATLAGYLLISSLQTDEAAGSGRRKLALIGGLLVACAMLTKSAAGLMPFFIIGAYALFSGSAVRTVALGWRELLICILAALIPPAVYLYLRWLSEPGIIGGMVMHEVYKRATIGYANQNHPLYYLIMLFRERFAVPPELLVPATVLSLYLAWKRRMVSLFLVCWSWVPVLLFSIAKSKLQWYIAPAFPGMSLMTGGMLALALREVLRAPGLRTAPLAFLALYGAGITAWNQSDIAADIFDSRPRSFMNQLAENFQKDYPKDMPRVVAYHLKLSRDEHLYLGMLRGKQIKRRDKRPLAEILERDRPALLLVPTDLIAEAARLRPIYAYAFSPVRFERRNWLAALALEPLKLPASFRRVSLTSKFKDLSAETKPISLLTGFGQPGEIAQLSYRPSVGEFSRMIIDADTAWRNLGIELVLNAASTVPNGALSIEINLNDEPLATIQSTAEGFHPYRLLIGPGQLVRGLNFLTMRYKIQGLPPTKDRAPVALFESYSVALNHAHNSSHENRR